MATGYNYPFWDPARFDRSVDAMVDTLVAKGVRHVIWVTLREVKPQYVSAGAWADVQPYYWYFPEVNQHLRAALTRHPELTLADWAALADQPGLSYDAIHLNTTGAALYARLLRTEVDGIGRLPGGQTLEVAVAGTHGVPADAAAVVLNVTVDDPKYAGYVTVQPCGAPAAVGLDRQLRVGHHGGQPRRGEAGHRRQGVRVHLRRHPRPRRPARLDHGAPAATPASHRCAPSTPAPPMPASRAGATAVVHLDAAGVPPGAEAVVVNVTAVDPRGPGYLSVSPCPGAAGPVSSVNYGTGQTVADLAVTPLAADGTICVQTYASAHVLVDVMGWFAAGSPFTPVDAPPGARHPRRRRPGRRRRRPHRRPAGAGRRPGRCRRAPPSPSPSPAPGPTATPRCTRAGSRRRWRPTSTTAPAPRCPPSRFAALPADGKVCVFTYATADVIVDLSGWVEAGRRLRRHHPDPPGRHPLTVRCTGAASRARSRRPRRRRRAPRRHAPASAAATTATMPMPRLNTRAISSSVISPRALDLAEDAPAPATTPGRTTASQPGRQDAGHVAGEAAAGDVGEAVHVDGAAQRRHAAASR